ncbi:hypothetical protein [Paralysiella testudinis]|uniref:Uncharacterized protein n=1 Tax=Paralysiella testudinis TaxID=2809020 RepID=A0A892ZN33_9NEIS|nr:hypothetical protein [Paralysiella testudinis]QRQ82249.1 hypothetical protein JQU52_02195 [Paralysiella testudinis]
MSDFILHSTIVSLVGFASCFFKLDMIFRIGHNTRLPENIRFTAALSQAALLK